MLELVQTLVESNLHAKFRESRSINFKMIMCKNLVLSDSWTDLKTDGPSNGLTFGPSD